jgi:hypothetical protein
VVAVLAAGAGSACAAGAADSPGRANDAAIGASDPGLGLFVGDPAGDPSWGEPEDPDTSSQRVAIEFVAPLPTSTPRCLASLPTRCSLPIVNTRTIRGDMTGVTQSTGGATIEAGRFTSLVGNDAIEITDGPCGAGTFVAQTAVANADMVRQPDGSTRFVGDVQGRIVPGSGTGGYENASYQVEELGQRPSPGDGTNVLYAVLQFTCSAPVTALPPPL